MKQIDSSVSSSIEGEKTKTSLQKMRQEYETLGEWRMLQEVRDLTIGATPLACKYKSVSWTERLVRMFESTRAGRLLSNMRRRR